jgi:hypothetical protein
MWVSWVNNLIDSQHGWNVFSFTVQGTLNGQPVALKANSPPIWFN